MTTQSTVPATWDRYRQYLYAAPESGLSVDVSRVHFDDADFATLTAATTLAMQAMDRLEAGAIANAEENRMVGHYWLRAPHLAPTPEFAAAITTVVDDVSAFAAQFHAGTLGKPFKHVLHIGIGGSTSGPQLLCNSLKTAHDPATLYFLDNSDPDGIDMAVAQLKGKLDETLVSVVSKCGFTPTPRYVHFEVEAIFKRHGLDFARHAVATTTAGSDLDQRAIREGWLARFPMWDWVGGRTSVTSAVGLLPAALQGIDIHAFLAGAATMDRLTRAHELSQNPAALLAAMWFHLGNGRGEKNMVLLPYKDRLALLPRFVQQLVMESIGKKHDRDGREVRQGLTVYGNKGSTDQHSYFQQLRDGANDFFLTFVHTLAGRQQPAIEIMPGVTLDDYLFGAVEGSRNALWDRGRDSLTVTLPDISPRSLGMLIALYERAVCLYAELINVNSYNQPGVDKHVATPVAELQSALLVYLQAQPAQTAEEIAANMHREPDTETIYKLLNRLAVDPQRGILRESAAQPFQQRFSLRR